VGEDAALQIAAELTLDIFRNRPVVVVAVAALGEPGLEVFLDGAIESAEGSGGAANTAQVRCPWSGARPPCLALKPRVPGLRLRAAGTRRRSPLATGTRSRGSRQVGWMQVAVVG